MHPSQCIHHAFMPITFDGEEMSMGREWVSTKGVYVYHDHAEANDFIKSAHSQKMSPRKQPTRCQEVAQPCDNRKNTLKLLKGMLLCCHLSKSCAWPQLVVVVAAVKPPWRWHAGRNTNYCAKSTCYCLNQIAAWGGEQRGSWNWRTTTRCRNHRREYDDGDDQRTSNCY